MTEVLTGSGVRATTTRLQPHHERRIVDDRIDQVLTIDDAALRNLWITQTYADLATRLRPVFGSDHTWCSFATWWSATSGVAIRASSIPRLVDDLLVGGDHAVDGTLRRLGRRTWIRRRLGLMTALDRTALTQVVGRGLGAVGDVVARRNAEVFEDLAPAFVRFVTAVETGVPLDSDDAIAAVAGGRAEDDRDLVRLAFAQYASARDTSLAAERRAEHVLAGNVALMLHEQRRTQDLVAAPFASEMLGMNGVLAELFHQQLPAAVRRRLASSLLDEIGEEVEDLWHHVSTRLLMTILLPGEVIHVGRGLGPTADGRLFPPELAEPRCEALVDLLQRCGEMGDAPHGAPCGDWTDEAERVRYLADLLRSRQRDPSLATPPFTDGELTAMARGHLPPLS